MTTVALQEEYYLDEKEDRLALRDAIAVGLLSRKEMFHFQHLHKGCYTYKSKDKNIILHGGEATYECAYSLTLDAEEPLENFV